jgi:tetratricopeptide (TPR) repeat protein
VKHSVVGVAVAVAWCVAAVAGVAEARNPNCAGGIQYLDQALRDNEKGNKEDYQREIGKALQRLEMCVAEDPKDLESLGYLGYVYAQVDSAALAGQAFARAIEGLTARGDKKKADWAIANRDHFWTIAFNDGINKIGEAQSMYSDYSASPSSPDEEKLKAEATVRYEEAIASLTRAWRLKPGDVRTIRNLGAVYAFRSEFDRAAAVFREGLEAARNDSSLVEALGAIRVNQAGALVEAKKYDEAIALYESLAKSDASNAGPQMGLADAHFRRAQTWSPEVLPPAAVEVIKKSAPNDQQQRAMREALADSLRKADFSQAGHAYAKAGTLKPDNADLPFNAALGYQNAGEMALSEAQWRIALKLRPNGVDIMSLLGAVLADQKKYDESMKVLYQAMLIDPKNKILHRQLGAVYTKAGNNARGTEELMVFLALQNGQPAADAEALVKKAPAGSAAAKTLASAGTPEQVYQWEADREKYETWFYWSKQTAYHFKAGVQVVKSDWNISDRRTPAPGGK